MTPCAAVRPHACRCDWLDICLFMRQQPPHVLSIAAADEHIIRLLQRSGLGCRGSSSEGGAGGRDCPLPPLGRKWLSALTRYKSFIWFVVFLTKRSQSRNKLRHSIPSAPCLPKRTRTQLTSRYQTDMPPPPPSFQ